MSDEPVSIECDYDWLDWAPGQGPLFSNDTPRQMMERHEAWPSWRKRLARIFGQYEGRDG